MKIENCEVMCLKVEKKENKEKVPYWMVSLVTVDDSEVFDILVKDFSLIADLQPFTKSLMNFSITNSKYGLKISII